MSIFPDFYFTHDTMFVLNMQFIRVSKAAKCLQNNCINIYIFCSSVLTSAITHIIFCLKRIHEKLEKQYHTKI